ncbi:MAG: hypothetical protein WCV64_12185, partial [Desulfurivibrionaceae bacterium]
KVIEGLSGAPASVRAQTIRALALELERLANHVGDIGALATDVGFLPTASFCGRLRGDYLNMTAALCGSRFGRGLARPGGVLFDLAPPLAEEMLARLKGIEGNTLGALDLFFDAPSVLSRFEGRGRLSRSVAEDLGLVGVAAKACAVPRDSRFFHPTGVYRHLFDDLITEETGDAMARAKVRSREISVSIELLRRIMDNLPEGPIRAPVGPLKGNALAISLVEGWRGEVLHVGLTDNDGRLRRYKIVDPSSITGAGWPWRCAMSRFPIFPCATRVLTSRTVGLICNDLENGAGRRGIGFIRLFISLLAQRNEPKKGPPVSLVPPLAGGPVLLDAAGALQTRLRLKQCKALFRQPLRCSAAGQWDFDCI